MEALECIKTRRSVRRFTEEPVTPEQVAEVVAAAAYAPSWKNTQIARYILVEDAQKREKIASDCVLDFTYNANTLSHAPALVALTMVTGRSGFERDGSYSSPLEGHWQSFDAGIAAQTFCLAAHALGLGTVIMGIYDPDKVAKGALRARRTDSGCAHCHRSSCTGSRRTCPQERGRTTERTVNEMGSAFWTPATK